MLVAAVSNEDSKGRIKKTAKEEQNFMASGHFKVVLIKMRKTKRRRTCLKM